MALREHAINSSRKMFDFQGKKVALLGFGIENQAMLAYLQARGARVVICDKNPGLKPPAGIEAMTGPDYLKDIKYFDVVFRSPGISFWTPEIQEALATGTLVTSQTKYFIHETGAKLIGVTGTKGKSTTASIIKAILDKARERGEVAGEVYLAGNIGTPAIEILDKAGPSDWVILELSSFQLQDLDKSPHIAVVLPITSDHLDYHESREEYIQSKQNIVRYQTESDYLVTNTELETAGTKIGYNPLLVKGDPLLPGRHNLQNFAAAAAAAKLAGASEDSVLDAIFTFRGLPHRLEFVAEKNGVKYYDDSKSTTPESTMAAISSFSEPIVLILGGVDKGVDYSKLVDFVKKSNVKKVIGLGALGKNFAGELKGVYIQGSMVEVVKNAAALAEPGDVVLLSPAAASYDVKNPQIFTGFKNAEDRGEQFQAVVKSL